MTGYKNFNQLNENAIDSMISNIVEERLLEFFSNDGDGGVFLELRKDVNGILMTDEDGNFEYIDEEEYANLMEYFNVIDEDEEWCVGTVDPAILSGIYESEDMCNLKNTVLSIFMDEDVRTKFIEEVYNRVNEFAPLAGVLPAIGGVAKSIAGATIASIPMAATFEAGSRAYKSVKDKKKFNSEKV